jgi:phosphoribosylamine--glycine ligase
MKVLVLGSGGREHAIIVALSKSAGCEQIFAAPGNGGSAGNTQNVDLDIMDSEAVVSFALDNRIDLVVIGPEAPLVAGIADALRAVNVLVFGPGAAGARLEGSKQFSKQLMQRHNIPTANFAAFTNEEEALAYLNENPAPIVIKADGLAAGKGVTVATSNEEAVLAVRECFAGRFGNAGATVVIEEYLEGPECSLLAFTDGITVLPMAPAQDHKRAFDGDLGPNTGGMGVYSPVPLVSADEYQIMVSLLEKTVRALREEGIDYRGVLYGGFMLTACGPKVLEYNARFGDPETQVILPRLQSDLAEVMLACASQRLAEVNLQWSDDWAVSVVLASGGYPGNYQTGHAIFGVAEAEQIEGVSVYHAGTILANDGILKTAGGRVLNVTATAAGFAQARERAYQACDKISFEGKQYRTDIGYKAMQAGY